MSPDRREHPFLLPLALANGNEKDVEGRREYGLLEMQERFAPKIAKYYFQLHGSAKNHHKGQHVIRFD